MKKFNLLLLFLCIGIVSYSQLTVSATTSKNVSCYGGSNGIVTSSASSGTTPYTYSWSPSSETTQTASGLSSATYTVTVHDVHGLTGTASTTVTQPTAPLSITATAQYTVVCPGVQDSLFASGSGGTVPYSYSWNAPYGDIIGCNSCARINLFPDGNAYVVTAVNDLNGCSATASVSVAVYPFPYVTIAGSINPIIAGHPDTLVAHATGATSYAWSNAATTSAIIVTPMSSATYSVMVHNTYGCYDTATYFIDTSSGNGTSSSTAIRVIPHTNVTWGSYSTKDSVDWFSFKAADSNTQILCNSVFLGMPYPHTHRLTLYNSSLQTIMDENMPDIMGANQIRLDASHLTIGNTYYVRAARCPAHSNMAGCNPNAAGECNPTQRWDFQLCVRTVPVFIPKDSANEAPSVNQLYYEDRGQIADLNDIPRFDIKAYTNNTNPAVYASDSAVSFVYQGKDSIQRVDMVLTGSAVQPSEPVFKMEEDSAAGYLNYFKEYIANGVPQVEGYSRLVYKNVYPNTDMQIYSNTAGVKLYFVCAPGSGTNPSDIELEFKGANSVSVNGSGGINVVTDLGTLTFAQGYASIDSAGVLKPESWHANFVAVNSNTVKFNIGAYNTNEPLIIQVDRGHLSPSGNSCIENLCWSTYYGGSGEQDVFNGVYTDASGNIYTAGLTSSHSFPVTPGAFQDSLIALSDAVMVKFDSTTKREWATYYGGSSNDAAQSIVADDSGYVFVTGYTYSQDFPRYRPNANAYYQAYLNRDIWDTCPEGDAFIVALDPVGKHQKWATWWGGMDYRNSNLPSEVGNSILLDGKDSLYVVGGHTDYIYTAKDPVKNEAGAYNSDTGSGIILKFNGMVSSPFFGHLDWATNFGGDNHLSDTKSSLYGGALDANNNLFVVGATDCGSFPVGYTHTLRTYEGNTDAVIAKLDASTNAIDWAEYYGGDNIDIGTAIALSGSGNVYITGYTNSPTDTTRIPLRDPNPGHDFSQAHDNCFGSGYNAFMAELNNSSGGIYWSTYYGGSYYMWSYGIGVDADSNLYITGAAEGAFPLPGSPIANTYTLSFAGARNIFLAGFTNQLQYGWGTLINQHGGTYDQGNAATVDKTRNLLYIVGTTGSKNSNYPIIQYDNGFLQSANNEPTLESTGCISRFNLSPFIPTAVDNISNKSDGNMVVYPNPANNNITVEFNIPKQENVELIMYNMMGQVVYYKSMPQEPAGMFNTEISLTSLPNGIYLIKANEGEHYVTRKVVKQN